MECKASTDPDAEIAAHLMDALANDRDFPLPFGWPPQPRVGASVVLLWPPACVPNAAPPAGTTPTPTTPRAGGRLSRASQPPELRGWLKKLKHKSSSVLSSWNRRYFVVERHTATLAYFSKDPSKGKGKVWLAPLSLHCPRLPTTLQYGCSLPPKERGLLQVVGGCGSLRRANQ